MEQEMISTFNTNTNRQNHPKMTYKQESSSLKRQAIAVMDELYVIQMTLI